MPYFDKTQKLKITTTGHLPHWHQDGKIQYVTFRLADALPQSKQRELKFLADQFLHEHPLPWDSDTAKAYRNMVGDFTNEELDKNYGSCILGDAAIRNVLIDTIRHFDGLKYEIIAYVIMPNHVHILLLMLDNYEVSDVIHSIKSYSAVKINKILGRTGALWQRESFDRIVRSYKHLEHYIRYIESNPAYLNTGEFELYVNKKWLTPGG